MSDTASTGRNRFPSAGHLVVIALAGLLVVYHTVTVFGVYERAESNTLSAIEYVQLALRMMIIVSLSLVIFRVRNGLFAMWVSIGGLIASQYWAHFGGQTLEIIEGRHALSYLRGFIFPTIITILSARK